MPIMTLKAARVNVGLSRQKAAELLEISPDQLYNWESGRSQPKGEDIKRLVDLYGVPFDQLVFCPKVTP